METSVVKHTYVTYVTLHIMDGQIKSISNSLDVIKFEMIIIIIVSNGWDDPMFLPKINKQKTTYLSAPYSTKINLFHSRNKKKKSILFYGR